MADKTQEVSASSWAREARFRLQAPNSSARDILVIPLDAAVAPLVSEVALQPWKNARFAAFSAAGEAWRAALDQHAATDLVVIIGQAGEDLGQAISVGELCINRQIKTSGVLLRHDGVSLPQMSASLRSMRPWTRTLAVIAEADYLPGLLHALGA
jgi:hypothetical protein